MKDRNATGKGPGADRVPGPHDEAQISRLEDWLMGEALGETTPEQIIAGACDRLRRAGVPLVRAMVGFRVLHPLYHGFTVSWTRETGAMKTGHLYADGMASPDWLASPFYHLLNSAQREIRLNSQDAKTVARFPVLRDVAAAGGGDYLAISTPFANDPDHVVASVRLDGLPGTDGILMSWAADADQPFSDADIAVLKRIQKRIAVAAKMEIRRQTADNLVRAYLGPHAGQRVLDGQIRRGAGEDIRAVIWFCDLWGSTPLAESMPRADFLSVLNDFFEIMADSVQGRGGEVLRFIGDAALAIFPVEGDQNGDPLKTCGPAADACRAALDAALDARRGVNRLNATRISRGDAALCFSVGLHLGEITYGNIGSPERIEFTVIGAAANEAARIQSKCKELDAWCLASDDVFNTGGQDDRLRSAGSHPLRGVERPVALFRLI